MGAANLYEEDIYAWAEQQAAALRRLAGLGGLPNELDLEHVTEEIADLGISELNGAKSYIRNILSHLILLRLDGAAPAVGHWTREVITWQAELQQRLMRAMHRRIDLDDVWRRAVREADRHLEAENRTDSLAWLRLAVQPAIGSACPFSLDYLLDDSFRVLDAVPLVTALDLS